MSEVETLRRVINIAWTYLRAGGAINTAEALKVLEEGRATPREPTGLEERGA